jgi:hypothetical protein
MDALNTGLLIGLFGFGAGVVVTLALVLLVTIYRNTVGCNDKKDDDDEEGFIIPMSQLRGLGGGGGGGYSMADIQKASDAIRQMTSKDEPPKAAPPTGNYL